MALVCPFILLLASASPPTPASQDLLPDAGLPWGAERPMSPSHPDIVFLASPCCYTPCSRFSFCGDWDAEMLKEPDSAVLREPRMTAPSLHLKRFKPSPTSPSPSVSKGLQFRACHRSLPSLVLHLQPCSGSHRSICYPKQSP